MRFATAIVFICLATGVARAGTTGLDGAVGALVFVPLSSSLSETYKIGVGMAADLGWVYSPRFRMSIQVSPQISWGTPRAGSLAAEPEGRFFALPAHAVIQYTHPSGDPRPYGGVGAGVMYVRESVSFQGPLGEENPSVSGTRFSWTVMAGLEKGKKSRVFVEAYYQHSSTRSIEGQSDSGVSLASLQFRVGVRSRLK